jgi:hypothetical protein
LPPYSPDLNPIEKFWANLKQKLSYILHLFLSLFDAIQYAFLEWDDCIKSRTRKKVRTMRGAVSVYKKENIVYVDEGGIDRHLHRRNARSAKGKKVRTMRRQCPRTKILHLFPSLSDAIHYAFLE